MVPLTLQVRLRVLALCCLASVWLSVGQARAESPLSWALMPDDDLFSDLIADPKQPHSYVGYERTRYREYRIPDVRDGVPVDVASVAVAATFNFVGVRKPGAKEGIELGLTGAVFSQFNWDSRSADLLNSDFFVAAPITARWGPLSGRLRVFHQSSHWGDETLLHSKVPVVYNDLSLEAVDGLVSGELGPARLYAGCAHLISSNPHLRPWTAQVGLELRGPNWHLGILDASELQLVGGADLKLLQEADWSTTFNAVAGIEWHSTSTTRALRLVFNHLQGVNPYGQVFFTQRVNSNGFEFQFTL